MRIAIANAGICQSRGGAERAALRLAHEMRARGHTVHILTVAGTYSPLYSVDPRLPIHFFPSSFFSGDAAAVNAGSGLLQENKIEVLLSFESDWKHMLWKICSTDTGTPFICSERITLELIERELWHREGRLALLEQSAAIHELLPCYVPLVPKHLRHKTFVIPNASPENIPPECPEHPSTSPTLLYLGRFSKEKRPELLLRAFALLAQEFPDWRLRMIGWGDTQSSLQALSQELNLDSCTIIGPVATSTWAEYLSANIYCLPTKYEGCPNTVLEAMAAGLPIVGVSDCPAMTSIVRNGINGLLANFPTPEALANILRPLLASEKARQRMGREAWHECNTRYSSALFDQWESILKKVVAKNITDV